MLHMATTWSHTYIQHNQHTRAFRLPLRFRSVSKTTPATTVRGGGERSEREILTTQADGSAVVSELTVVFFVLARSLAWQCCTWRFLGRRAIFGTITTLPCTPSHCHSCSDILRKRVLRLQNVAGRTYSEICSPCKQTAVLSCRNLQ